ncbi:DegV family protein [Niallia taxi]|uniref:DegV family protein n=1 Tax=Niallia taxi TaxID=2499688 RepID=UPI00203CBAD3|nr:DegV family protein [Niallia taxi]MCM3216026.1 DegV family protein [Niallia taxi]MDK8639183.1 DegV family protein [Niallia taxi]MED4036987.1 DegV family protein [Niallia taxi]
MTYKIMADSACDLPLSYYDDNEVILFPLKVNLENKEYEDLKTINPSAVYEAIRRGEVPKTSQVSPSLFKDVFTEMAQNGESGIYVAFSSQLSGTYQTAQMIYEQVQEEYPEFQLSIIDSKCASLGAGLAVQECVKQRQLGKGLEEAVKQARFVCEHMEHLFTVEDLEYLAKGGRVSKASAFVGGLLQIKPLLHVEDGKLVPLEKIRGKKKLLRRMLDVMEERGVSLDTQTIAISHADDLATATELKEAIMERFHPIDVYISSIGAAVGSHTGAGTIALFFQNSK